ncbi:MAG: T9SS type A sorting domain-containing protein [Putridiphycobacter sp.]|nr:T9SS type A sorting domain-containing protein [Putridiphycobacter sp.]
MKTKFITLLTIFCFMPILAKAQNSFYNDSSQIDVCDTSYYISIAPNSPDFNAWTYGNFVISGTNIINSNFDLDVVWGDGDTTNHTGTAVTNGTAITWNNPLSHTYVNGGSYTITLLLTDLTNSVTYTTLLDINMGACPHYIYNSGQVDCDNDGIIDSTLNSQIPLILTDGNGNSYSGFQTATYSVFYGLLPGTYTASVDPTWLANHGYLASNLTPTTITTNWYSGNFTFQTTLICDSTLFISNCLNGVVYCDANNNGVMDSLETPVAGAPLTLTLPNGSTYVSTSDNSGLYNFSYSGFTSGGYVSVDQNWLNLNGYFTSLFFNDSLSDLDCANNPTLNIPIICDTSALSVGCVDGYVYCDDNGNGVMDSSEMVFYNTPVTLSGLGGLITVYTDSTGYYSYTGWQLSGGQVFVSVDQGWQVANSAYVPMNGVFINSLNCANNNQTNLGLNCTTVNTCADLWSSVTPWNGYYQNFSNSVWLKWGNYGTSSPGSYTLTLDFPSGVTPVVTSINNSNYTITGNTITWTLSSSSTSMYYSDVIYFNTPSGIPDSTFHIFSTSISSSTSDCDSTNNYSTLGMYVGNSYDPNDKSVNKPYIVNPDIQDQYTYVVRFQNTGTAPAQDIYILDTLSTNLDWTTLEIIEATHPMQLVDLGNGVIKFDFPQIWLPDSTTSEPLSHGQVVYRIKELSRVGEGDAIENTAYIYFDQNPAIVTNTTVNLNTVGLGIQELSSVEFNIYPNPTNGVLNIETKANILEIRIIDLSGKEIYRSSKSENLTTLNLDSISSGIYSLEILTTEGTGRSLFIKE